jgi:hypothetical protein
LDEVRASIQRNSDEKKRGFAEKQLSRLADCVHRGLDEVQVEQEKIRQYVKDVEEVAATLEPREETCADRQERFEELIDRLQRTEDPIRLHTATAMVNGETIHQMYTALLKLPRTTSDYASGICSGMPL